MPPRLPLCSLTSNAFTPPCRTSIPTFLLPFLQATNLLSTAQSSNAQRSRPASILSSLRNVPSSYNKKIRRGRGPSSGKGKTSGRGHKGQKQHGKVPKQFTGGQTPDEIVHGHYGFDNIVHRLEMSEVNLSTIQSWINQKRLDPAQPITLRELCSSRAVGRIRDGVKLLARGKEQLSSPINIIVSRASKSAIAAVEAVGGTVTTRFYTPLAIRRIKNRLMHPYISLRWDQTAIGIPALEFPNAHTLQERVKGLGYEYRLPDPTGRKDLEYYRDKSNRGYLSHLVPEGGSPSLYYKTESELEELKRAREQAKGTSSKTPSLTVENKMW